MRNMLQLLGGVAVAGAVAAGTTAFTNSGVTLPATAFGGTGTVVPTGITVASVVANWDAAVAGKLTSFTVTSSTSVTDGTKVFLSVTDPSGTWAGATGFTCTDTASNVSTCTPASVYTPNAITQIKISVHA